MKRSILLGALLVLTIGMMAQEDSAMAKPSIQIDQTAVKIKKDHSPRKALLYSAVLPGLGQAYNKEYWKIPLIYGGGVAMVYGYTHYNNIYTRFRTAYNQLSNEQEVTDPELQGKSLEFLKLNRDAAFRNQTLNLIFLGILYFANVVDAMVFAHLYEYDIGENLTLRAEPTMILPENLYSQPSCGLKLSIRF